MPELIASPFPGTSDTTFNCMDFNTVRETDVMNYNGRCVAGNCSTNVIDVDYYRK